MHFLGWIVCGVGYLMLSMSARAHPLPRVYNGRNGAGRQRRINSGVHLLVLRARLIGIARSIQQDYARKRGPPDNVLTHIGMMDGIFLVFAGIKDLTSNQIVKGLELIFVHDLIELVMPGGDKPPYDRSTLSRVLETRLKQLGRFAPPTQEEWKRTRERSYRRYLPYIELIVADLEDPESKRWVRDRFRSFYLSETKEARLARECDRLSDAFLAAYYAGQGEEVQQFLAWAVVRVRDPDLAAALEALKPYYTPKVGT